MLRTSQILLAGIHRRDLYALRDAGILEAFSRGLYRLTELPPLAEPDLVTVAARVPKAVVCLISALHFHGLTTEIPRNVSIALPRGTARPRLAWPPLRVYYFSRAMFDLGIETHPHDGLGIRVYVAAKTVADCFKFRNRIGMDVPIEALRSGLSERKFTPAEVMRFAKICRVDRIVRPILEAMQ
jgi:predicted transcriptional regulator of viral defense system